MKECKGSEHLVAKEVKSFWEKTYPADVVCFFKQKYEDEKEYDAIATIAYYDGQNIDNVEFHDDFWEGQTVAKDITIVNLDDVMMYYYDNVIEKVNKDG